MSETMKPKKIEGYKILLEGEDGYAYRTNDGLQIIQSIAREGDGKFWLHTSLARRSRMPEYKDIAFVKRVFIGDDVKAFMVFPEREYHVNIHEYCLHLYSCLEDSGMPEFSANGVTI